MSLILDALRGGREPAAPPPNPNASQTDAVLQTLGYNRSSSASPLNRIKRLASYVAVGAVVAIVIVAAMIWVTRTYLGSGPPPASISTPSSRASAPAPATVAPGAVPPQALPTVQNEDRPDVPSGPAPPPAGALVPANDHFQLALYYQRIGDFENSLVHYRAVLQRDELNAEAHNNLGLLYREKGLFGDAVKEFQRAIAINQRYVKAHNNLGVAYLSQRKNDAATGEFRTALSIDPRNVESLLNLSRAEKEAGHRDEARATLTRAIDIDSHSAEAHYNLALIADDMGDKALALQHYRSFLQYATDHPDLVPEVRRRIQQLEPKK